MCIGIKSNQIYFIGFNLISTAATNQNRAFALDFFFFLCRLKYNCSNSLRSVCAQFGDQIESNLIEIKR